MTRACRFSSLLDRWQLCAGASANASVRGTATFSQQPGTRSGRREAPAQLPAHSPQALPKRCGCTPVEPPVGRLAMVAASAGRPITSSREVTLEFQGSALAACLTAIRTVFGGTSMLLRMKCQPAVTLPATARPQASCGAGSGAFLRWLLRPWSAGPPSHRQAGPRRRVQMPAPASQSVF